MTGEGIALFTRINRLAIELPEPEYGDANAAAAVQELLGGRFGEMSTLNNYLYQSFNFRGKRKLKPFYDLVASITAEEVGHVELVSNAINLCMKGITRPGDPDTTPLANGLNKRNTYHFIASAQTALPGDSMGKSWTGDYVFTSGNLVLDLLHNFFSRMRGAHPQNARVPDDRSPDGTSDDWLFARQRRRACGGLRQGAGNCYGSRFDENASCPGFGQRAV